MRLTRRGKSALISSLAVLALGAGAGDPILLSAGAAVAAATFLDFGIFVGARAAARRSIRILPSSVRGSTVAGEEYAAEISLECATRGAAVSRVEAEPPFSLDAKKSANGHVARLAIKPVLLGKYMLSEVQVRMCSLLGFFSSSAKGKADVEVRAYPRFYPALLEALSLLEGGAGEGDARSGRIGRGTEYAWSREYEPGDSMKLIDWKSTARRGKYCVKDFHEERGEGALVVFDGRAPGPISADEMARDFLSALLGFAREGRRISVALLNSGGVLMAERVPAEVALEMGIREVFKMERLADYAPYELFPPGVRSQLERMGVPESGERGGVSADFRKAYDDLARRLRGSKADVLYVGCPIYDAGSLLGLAEAVAEGGGRLRAMVPKKAWLDADDLDRAYSMKKTLLKTHQALERIGIVGVTDPAAPLAQAA